MRVCIHVRVEDAGGSEGMFFKHIRGLFAIL